MARRKTETEPEPQPSRPDRPPEIIIPEPNPAPEKPLAKAIKAFRLKDEHVASHAMRENQAGDQVVVVVTHGGRKLVYPDDLEAVERRGGLTPEEKDGVIRSTAHIKKPTRASQGAKV